MPITCTLKPNPVSHRRKRATGHGGTNETQQWVSEIVTSSCGGEGPREAYLGGAKSGGRSLAEDFKGWGLEDASEKSKQVTSLIFSAYEL